MDDDLFKDQVSFFPFITDENYPDITQAVKWATEIRDKKYSDENAVRADRLKIGIIKNVRNKYMQSPLSSVQLELILEILLNALNHYRLSRRELNLP